MKNFLSNLWSLSRTDRVRTLAIDAVSLPSFCRVNMLKLVSVLVILLTLGVGNVWGVTYTKITSTTGLPADGSSAKYLIVYETLNYVYDGSKTGTNLSASGDYKSSGKTTFTRSGSTITIKGTDNFYFTISRSGNNYIIQSASGYYIGRTENSNGLNQSTSTSYNHTITFSNNNAQITSSGGPKLQFLNSSGSYTFKYYKSSQKLVQLYKLDASCDNKVTISKGSESHGTFELNKTGEQDACDALSVTITPSPAEHYHVAAVSATNPTTTGTAGEAIDNGDGTWTITYSANAKGASTINVTFAEDTKHTLTFYNNGAQVEQIQVYDGEKIGASLPNLTSSEACHATSRTFAGWTTEYIGSTPVHTVDVDKIVDYWTKPTGDMTINAIWAKIPASATTTFAAADYTAATAPVTKTKDNITLYFDAGSIYKDNTPYTFSITSGEHYFSITASNKVLAKLATTCNDGTYCIYDVSDGTLSPNSSTASQTVTDINTYSVECYPKSNKQIRMQTCAVYCYDNYITACAACAADPTRGSASLKGGFSLSSVGVTATGWDAGTNCSWTDYGFVWGTSANPTVSDNKVPVGNSGTTTTWDGTLTGSFTTSTTYHFRAYGKNGKDGATYQYSDDATFTPRQVSFNMHGHGGDAPASQVVNNGGKATDPGDPSEAGWTFGGWYNNDSYTGSAWVFGTNTVSGGNVTLHAKWTEKPKYTITLNAGNGTVSAAGWEKDGDVWKQQQSNGDASITFPTPTCNCSGWVFQGWSTTSKSNAASFTPDKADGASFVPANDVTYFAVYRQSSAGGTTYSKITSAGDLTTGNYVITGMYNGTTPYKMDGSLYNEGVSLGESSASVTDGSLTESTASYVWTIIKFGSSVVFRNTSTSKFLAIVDGKFALQDEGQLFTYSVTSGAWTFTSPSGKQIIYATRYYVGDSQNREIHLYKQGSTPSGNFYTNPTCSDLSITGVADPAAGGSVTLSATSAKSGEKVYAYYTADDDYNFTSWSISGTGSTLSSTSAQFTEITVGTANTTVTANFAAKDWKTVTWKANGEALTGDDLGSASVKVENGYDITAMPPTPASCDGTSTTFIGWVEESDIWSGKTDDVSGVTIYEKIADFPTVTDNVVYHAVWAKKTGGSGNETLTCSEGTVVSNTMTFSTTNYTIIHKKNDSGATMAAYSPWRVYEKNTVEISGSMTITGLDIVHSGTYYGVLQSNKGTLTLANSSGGTTTVRGIDATEVIITNKSGAAQSQWTSIKIYYDNSTYSQYLVKCCNTPTLAFAASPYAVLREDLGGASTTTWAEVDVTFTSNSTGTISAAQYSNATVTNGTAYQLAASKWQVYETTGGTLCGATHAYFEVLTQPSGETPGTGKFHVKTAAGQTGQGTYRIAITQEGTDESHGNYCETTVYGFINVTLRDQFVDKLNGNGTVTRDGHGAQLATPTLSEFGTQVEDACHEEGRKLKGWIKETDLKAQYETGNSTRVQTIDGLCESCSSASDQTSLIVTPGTNVTMSGATWYAVWAYEK